MQRTCPVAVVVVMLMVCAPFGCISAGRSQGKEDAISCRDEAHTRAVRRCAGPDSDEAPEFLDTGRVGSMAGDHTRLPDGLGGERSSGEELNGPAFSPGDTIPTCALNKFTAEQIRSFHGKN